MPYTTFLSNPFTGHCRPVHPLSMPLAHSKDLRVGRWSETGQIYLVTTKTRKREPLFADFANGRALVTSMKWCDEQRLTRTWAFVVMPDHLHWLLQLGSEKRLSEVLASVKKRSSNAINQRMSRKGSIWQSGFHDHAVRQEENLRAVARYVVMNPVRAGMVESVREYSLWDASWI